jgi:hypothetical protein
MGQRRGAIAQIPKHYPDQTVTWLPEYPHQSILERAIALNHAIPHAIPNLSKKVADLVFPIPTQLTVAIVLRVKRGREINFNEKYTGQINGSEVRSTHH